jgi:hypothetical protein
MSPSPSVPSFTGRKVHGWRQVHGCLSSQARDDEGGGPELRMVGGSHGICALVIPDRTSGWQYPVGERCQQPGGALHKT